ncbi:hypothetical protein C7377_0228 [Balneicella halophila]|uniref:Uncharacterized protein n=1 Tax=Balneicella halophila TaxID=1537566 RepID=A0A7L4USH6_BALHA|nr:hypothetical protein [Balneicella halophila]PVX51934.1 hypothetical protein C7377_0228 [Balneicella halophila]
MSKKEQDFNPDVTKEEKERLDDSHLRNDGGDDEILKERERPVDFEGENLDIPGRTLPDDRNPEDTKDEENQHYSLPEEDL